MRRSFRNAHDALVRQRDRHAVILEAVDEVRGAVERVDDPLVLGLVVRLAGFFGEDGVIGVGGLQRVDDRRFRCLVDLRDEIVVLFLADLNQVEIERRPVDDLRGAAGGLDGDVEHGMHEPGSLCRGSAAAYR
jgi:hypothetical protein